MIPTPDNILEKIKNPTSSDVPVWSAPRSTLHNFMRKTGFVNGNRTTYYDHMKERADFVEMRENNVL